MRSNRLQKALESLSAAVDEARSALDEIRSEPDALATHIFVSRRQLRHLPDTKGGNRKERAVRMSWQTACELGFRDTLGEWERLMGTSPKR